MCNGGSDIKKTSFHQKDHRECGPCVGACGMGRILPSRSGRKACRMEDQHEQGIDSADGCLLTSKLYCASFQGKQEASLARAYDLCMICV